MKSTPSTVTLGVVTILGMLAMAMPDKAITVTNALALPEKKPFMVLDGTLYVDKPDLSQHGIQPITMIYVGQFGNEWYKNASLLPDQQTVQKLAREAQSKASPVVIDIEHWPLNGEFSQVQESLSKYMTVLQWFKETAPGLSVGFYGTPPIRDYWRAITPPTSKEWQSLSGENDRLRPLTGAVDILFPSLYTFYTDQGGWVRYAYGQIAEARRCANGKPVYVFLWPQYHSSNRKLAGTYLPLEYWKLELETARQYADGVILWGGWGNNNRPAKWEDNAGWWTVTKDFMRTVVLSNHPADRRN